MAEGLSGPAPDLLPELERTRSRLARERAARRESEDIAEAALRRAFDRQQELDLLSRVTSIANSATDAESALAEAMEAIRSATDWTVGHYFVPAHDDPSVMVDSGVWSGDPADPFLAELRRATPGLRFPPGVGIPGTSFQQGATWEEDIKASRNFPRQRWVTGGSAFAFPVLIGDEVAAIMEFLQPVPRPRREGLLEVAGVVGIQLGRAVERMRSRAQEQQHRNVLRDTVGQRTADLIAARDRAERQAQARAALFSTISHDLQTPLHAAIAQLREAPGANSEPHLQAVSLHLHELQRRIAALLDLAGSPAATGAAQPRVVALAELLRDAVSAHTATAGDGASAPTIATAAGADRPVLVDADRFQRIVHTLLAGRLIDEDAGPIRLHLRVQPAWAELTVEEPDPGPTSSTAALAAQLVESTGGSLHVEALPGGRRRVEARLPVAAQGRVRSGPGRRVLLVDDIAVTRQISAAMLTRLGAEVTAVAGGREAIDALRGGEYAMVFMDLRMPGMGGLEASRRIRAGEAGPERAEVPIVALTAHAAGDADLSLLAGMDAHMTKPFTVDDLRAALGRYAPEVRADPAVAGSPG